MWRCGIQGNLRLTLSPPLFFLWNKGLIWEGGRFTFCRLLLGLAGLPPAVAFAFAIAIALAVALTLAFGLGWALASALALFG